MLFDSLYKKIASTAKFMVRHEELVKEVIQETWLKALSNLNQLKDGEQIHQWIGAITTNTARDLLRKHRRSTEMNMEFSESIIADEFDLETEIDKRFVIRILRKHLAELHDEQKQVLLLKYYYDLTDDEIAAALDVKVGTVKSRIRRGKLTLRSALEAEISQGDDHCEQA